MLPPSPGPPRPANLSLACGAPPEAPRLPLLLLYGGVLLVGLPANLLTLPLTARRVAAGAVLPVYLWALALSDLGHLLTLPLWAAYVAAGWRWRWGDAACRLTAFVFFTNMYVSVFLLACVALDRWLAVARSLEARGRRRRRHAAALVAAVVLLVAAGHAPVFTMPAGAEGRCFEPQPGSGLVAALSGARVGVGFLLPAALLLAASRGAAAGVRRSPALRRGQKRRVRRLLGAVVLLFLGCYAPYHLVLLARAAAFLLPAAACRLQAQLHAAHSVSLGLATVSSAANPVLYVLSSQSVRRELRQGLRQLWAWARSGARSGTRSGAGSRQNQVQVQPRPGPEPVQDHVQGQPGPGPEPVQVHGQPGPGPEPVQVRDQPGPGPEPVQVRDQPGPGPDLQHGLRPEPSLQKQQTDV